MGKSVAERPEKIGKLASQPEAVRRRDGGLSPQLRLVQDLLVGIDSSFGVEALHQLQPDTRQAIEAHVNGMFGFAIGAVRRSLAERNEPRNNMQEQLASDMREQLRTYDEGGDIRPVRRKITGIASDDAVDISSFNRFQTAVQYYVDGMSISSIAQVEGVKPDAIARRLEGAQIEIGSILAGNFWYDASTNYDVGELRKLLVGIVKDPKRYRTFFLNGMFAMVSQENN